MVPRGSVNEKLTNVGTRNCYICNKYLASLEVLLIACIHIRIPNSWLSDLDSQDKPW